MTQSGLGISVLPNFIGALDKTLRPILPMIQIRRSFSVVVHRDLAGVSRVRSVIDWLDTLVQERFSSYVVFDQEFKIPNSKMLYRHILRTNSTLPATELCAIYFGQLIGLDKAILPYIFEAFVTKKPAGLGIGLSVAQTIIKAHGGKIKAQNLPEGGAVISFTIPFISPEPK